MSSFYPDFQGSTYCDSSLLHTNRWYPTCVCVGILFSWEMSFLKLRHDAISMRMESLVTSGLGSTADSPGLNFTSTASIHPSVSKAEAASKRPPPSAAHLHPVTPPVSLSLDKCTGQQTLLVSASLLSLLLVYLPQIRPL